MLIVLAEQLYQAAYRNARSWRATRYFAAARTLRIRRGATRLAAGISLNHAKRVKGLHRGPA